jgi:hypothetical protein
VLSQLGWLSQLLVNTKSPSSGSVWGLADDRQRLQAAVMLCYELQEQDYGVVDQFPVVLSFISWGPSLVVESHGILVPVSQPTWFDPCILLRKKWSRSQRQGWQIELTDVGCSFLHDNSSASEEECIRRAVRWSRLLHPNVVALEAASYVGTPFFIYTHGAPLAEVVNAKMTESASDLKWTRLHEAALGLQYLQSRGVAFHALTPESILLVEIPAILVVSAAFQRLTVLSVKSTASASCSCGGQITLIVLLQMTGGGWLRKGWTVSRRRSRPTCSRSACAFSKS